MHTHETRMSAASSAGGSLPPPHAAGAEIGSGVSGVVFAATDVFAEKMIALYGMKYGSEFAVKVFHHNEDRHDEDFHNFCKEVAVYKELADVPEIVPLVHWSVKMQKRRKRLEIQSHLIYPGSKDAFTALNDKVKDDPDWKVVEMCQTFPLYKGTLSDLARSLRKYSLMERLLMCKMVVDGMYAMHMRRILHGDLHPGNVLYRTTADGELKLAIHDLGLTEKIESASEQDPSLYNYDTSLFGEIVSRIMPEHLFHETTLENRIKVGVEKLIEECLEGSIQTLTIVRSIDALILKMEK